MVAAVLLSDAASLAIVVAAVVAASCVGLVGGSATVRSTGLERRAGTGAGPRDGADDTAEEEEETAGVLTELGL